MSPSEAANVELTEVVRGHRVCLTLLGLSPARSIWGSKPLNFGIGKVREPWYQNIDAHHGHGETPTWFNTKWYHVPRIRHLWGDSQYEVHPGGQELFLDLIFVGVAYQVGGLLKEAFYGCVPVGDHTYERQLAGDTSNGGCSAPPSCVGLGIGILHSLAPFMCMYLLWGMETRLRAQFKVVSKVHFVLDAVGNLLLIFAGMSMQSPTSYRERRDVAGLSRVIVPLVVDLFIWIARLGEIALFSHRDNARQQSTFELITALQVKSHPVA